MSTFCLVVLGVNNNNKKNAFDAFGLSSASLDLTALVTNCLLNTEQSTG